MSAFIKIKTYHNGIVVDAFVNVDRIVMVWDADYRDDMEGQCFYNMTDGFSTEHAAEPYETVVGKIIAATSKEKENLPPTPPIREKEVSLNKPRARAYARDVREARGRGGRRAHQRAEMAQVETLRRNPQHGPLLRL